MTKDEIAPLGRRLDKLENEVQDLSTGQAALKTALSTVSSNQSDLAHKIDRLISSVGATESTKGMVPVSMILTVLGVVVAVSSVGLTALNFFSNDIKADIAHSVEIADLKHELVRSRMADDDIREESDKARFNQLEKDITEFRAMVHTSLNPLLAAGVPSRLAVLERVQKESIESFRTHMQELDHPQQQTYRLNDLEEDIMGIDTLGPRGSVSQ